MRRCHVWSLIFAAVSILSAAPSTAKTAKNKCPDPNAIVKDYVFENGRRVGNCICKPGFKLADNNICVKDPAQHIKSIQAPAAKPKNVKQLTSSDWLNECNKEFQRKTDKCQRPDGSWDRENCFKPAERERNRCTRCADERLRKTIACKEFTKE